MNAMRGMMLAAAASLLSVSGMAEDVSQNALQAKIKSCESCHGPNGNSNSSMVPRLNGQQADYIRAQMKNFRDPGREDPRANDTMWRVAEHTSDDLIGPLANYYASQTPTPPGAQMGRLAEEGKRIFQSGAPAQNLPVCSSCHGAQGQGSGAIPRLAGQHVDYLRKELEVLRWSLRESDVMHPKTNQMTDQQIEALAAYLGND